MRPSTFGTFQKRILCPTSTAIRSASSNVILNLSLTPLRTPHRHLSGPASRIGPCIRAPCVAFVRVLVERLLPFSHSATPFPVQRPSVCGRRRPVQMQVSIIITSPSTATLTVPAAQVTNSSHATLGANSRRPTHPPTPRAPRRAIVGTSHALAIKSKLRHHLCVCVC